MGDWTKLHRAGIDIKIIHNNITSLGTTTL